MLERWWLLLGEISVFLPGPSARAMMIAAKVTVWNIGINTLFVVLPGLEMTLRWRLVLNSIRLHPFHDWLITHLNIHRSWHSKSPESLVQSSFFSQEDPVRLIYVLAWIGPLEFDVYQLALARNSEDVGQFNWTWYEVRAEKKQKVKNEQWSIWPVEKCCLGVK